MWAWFLFLDVDACLARKRVDEQLKAPSLVEQTSDLAARDILRESVVLDRASEDCRAASPAHAHTPLSE